MIESMIDIVNRDNNNNNNNNDTIIMKNNEYLYGFESDIILYKSTNNELIPVLNIEIDGIHHQQQRKKSFCNLRDQVCLPYNFIFIVLI
jgi:hypothetical protein